MKKKHTHHKQHRFSRRRLIFFVKIALLFGIIGGFVYAMNQEYFFIKQTRISGYEILTENEIQTVVDEYLATKRFLVFPRKNTFFLDTSSLEKHISEVYPRIYTVDISLVERSRVLQIEIEERKAHSLWCNYRDYEQLPDEECFYADQDGYIYAESPYFSPKVFTKIFVPTGDIITQKQIYNGVDFSSLFSFLDALRDTYDIKIHHIERDIYGDISIFIWSVNDYIYKDNFPFLVYAGDMGYDRVLDNTRLTLEHEAFLESFSKQPENLKSIDVRFDGRVFFTFNTES